MHTFSRERPVDARMIRDIIDATPHLADPLVDIEALPEGYETSGNGYEGKIRRLANLRERKRWRIPLVLDAAILAWEAAALQMPAAAVLDTARGMLRDIRITGLERAIAQRLLAIAIEPPTKKARRPALPPADVHVSRIGADLRVVENRLVPPSPRGSLARLQEDARAANYFNFRATSYYYWAGVRAAGVFGHVASEVPPADTLGPMSRQLRELHDGATELNVAPIVEWLEHAATATAAYTKAAGWGAYGCHKVRIDIDIDRAYLRTWDPEQKQWAEVLQTSCRPVGHFVTTGPLDGRLLLPLLQRSRHFSLTLRTPKTRSVAPPDQFGDPAVVAFRLALADRYSNGAPIQVDLVIMGIQK
jgi:hypothetical protein